MAGGAVMVAGGAGYIGSHAVRCLRAHGRRVVVFDDLSKGHRDGLGDVPLVVGDIADSVRVRETVRAHDVGAVMHFAASIQVGESMSAPRVYWNNNVGKTLTFLGALHDEGVARVVFSSTAAVYGEPEGTPITEDAKLRPTSVYGRTKLVVEQVLADFAAAYGLRYAALRYFNAAGAHPSGEIGERHDPESHLIPLVLQAASGRRPHVQVFGTNWPTPDGTCVRDYIHVDDLAEAHVRALDALEREPRIVCNLGTGRGFSVRDVIAAAEREAGRPIPVLERPRRAGDCAVLVASNSRARALLGWEPRATDLDAIVASAWRWERRLT